MTSVYFYDAEGRDEQVELTKDLVTHLEEHQLLWLDLQRDDQRVKDDAARILGWDENSRAEVDEPPTPPRLQLYDGYFQFSVPLPIKTDGTAPRLDFLVAEKWLVTVRDVPIQYFDEFRDQDRGMSFRGNLTPAALTASLLDWHIESFQLELMAIGKSTDKIDTDILAQRERRSLLNTLAVMRRRVSRVRDALGEHRPIIQGMLRSDFTPVADTPDAEHFRAVERHFERAEDAVERAREAVVGSFDLYAARTAHETNLVIRALTVATVILGMISATACVFGMNFQTSLPQTGWLGFGITIGVMVLASIAIFAFFRLRKWV